MLLNSRKIYLFASILIIVGILASLFLIFILFKGVKNNSEAFSLEKEKITSLSEEKENRKKMEDLYKNYQSDLDKVEKVFIDPEVPIEFIGFLEKTAGASQVQLKILSMTKKTDQKDAWPNLLFQVSVTGSFFNFSKFLEKLENSPYLIETLELNSGALSEKEIKSKEFENFSSADTNTLLLIKVLARQ